MISGHAGARSHQPANRISSCVAARAACLRPAAAGAEAPRAATDVAGLCTAQGNAADSGEKPEPTVIVRMGEGRDAGRTGVPAGNPALGTRGWPGARAGGGDARGTPHAGDGDRRVPPAGAGPGPRRNARCGRWCRRRRAGPRRCGPGGAGQGPCRARVSLPMRNIRIPGTCVRSPEGLGGTAFYCRLPPAARPRGWYRWFAVWCAWRFWRLWRSS